jgi:hypothetical protein
MTYFARELRDILAGPPAIPQIEICRKARIPKSKMSRLLSDQVSCDRRTLDSILPAVPKPLRAKLVKAYLRDHLGPQAISCLAARPADLPSIDLPHNRRARSAVDFLVNRAGAEDLIIPLARALGWNS